jgi:hypothetical protein
MIRARCRRLRQLPARRITAAPVALVVQRRQQIMDPARNPVLGPWQQ